MSKLLENIINYYIEEIMERQQLDKNTAISILEETLQSENIDTEILDYAGSLNK